MESYTGRCPCSPPTWREERSRSTPRASCSHCSAPHRRPSSRGWFEALAQGGTIRDELQARPWGAWDGQVVDRFGVCWLIGFEDADT